MGCHFDNRNVKCNVLQTWDIILLTETICYPSRLLFCQLQITNHASQVKSDEVHERTECELLLVVN